MRAGERAASLGASAEAQRAFERAVELTDDPIRHGRLYERAGMTAYGGARADEAASHYERAIELFDAHGASHPAARVSARLAEIMWDRGRIEHGLEIMNRAFEVLSQEEPDEDLDVLAAQLGRFMFFAGQHGVALERIDTAPELALPFHMAVTELEHGEWLVAQGRGDDARLVLAEAREIFERLEGTPWIDRVHAVDAGSRAEVLA